MGRPRSAVTLQRLYRILQVVMGWTDSHMHGYRVPRPGRRGARRQFLPIEGADEKSTRLADLLRRPRDRVIYEYDFGGGLVPAIDSESDNLMEVRAMRDKTISATEAARSLSEALNQVQYRNRSFSINPGRKVVARLVPPASSTGLALADLNRLFAALPHLSAAEASRWRAEIETMRRARRPQLRST